MRLDPEKIRVARERLGLSLNAMAEAAEISETAAIRAAHGDEIRPMTARRLARGLQLEVEDLYSPKAQAALLSPKEAVRVERRGELGRWLEYAENRAAAWEELAGLEQNPFLQNSAVAEQWQSSIGTELVQMLESADKAVADVKTQSDLGEDYPRLVQELEEMYTRVQEASQRITALANAVVTGEGRETIERNKRAMDQALERFLNEVREDQDTLADR